MPRMLFSSEEMLSIFLDMARRELPPPDEREALLSSMNPIAIEESWLRLEGHLGKQTRHQFAVTVASLMGSEALGKPLGAFRTTLQMQGGRWVPVAVAARFGLRNYMDGLKSADMENPTGADREDEDGYVKAVWWDPNGCDEARPRRAVPVATDVLEYRVVWMRTDRP